MAGFFGAKPISTTAVKVAGLRVQTSAIGKPIPIVYGTARIAPNLLWYDDFLATPHTETTSGGGKGGGGISQSNTTYTYTASVIFGLCEGTIIGIGRVSKDKKVYSMAAATVPSATYNSGMTAMDTYLNGLKPIPAPNYLATYGTINQSAWGYLTSMYPDKAIPYSNTAYFATTPFDLADSGQLSNMTFEVFGRFSEKIDANPKDIIYDFLTNAQYGAGFNTTKIGDWTNYYNYCQAYGLLLSPAFEEQKGAGEHLKEIMRATNSEFVWSEGLLKIVPYGDTALGSYVPNTTPIYDLNDDDFCSVDEPIKITRSTPADAFNQIQIEFTNRANSYNNETSDSKDSANIELFGLRPNQTETMHSICDATIAKTVSQLILQRTLYIRNTYEFQLSYKYSLLEPMDIVTVTDSVLGLDKFPVRIKTIIEDDSGTLLVTAEEFPFGVSTATAYPKQGIQATNINYAVKPSNANDPIIFEAPDTLTTSGFEVWICVSGQTNWGGADIYVSNDGNSYSFLSNVAIPCRTGNIVSDGTTTIDIDLTESNGTLQSVSAADATALSTLCYADGELLAYSTASLTSLNKYTLGGLVRGAYNTPIAIHPLNSRFARLDGSVIKMPFTGDRIGDTIYFKILSYNQYGSAKQQLSEVGASQYKIMGSAISSPLPDVTNVISFFSNSQSAISWDTVVDFRTPIDYEIRLGSSWDNSTTVAKIPSAPFIAGVTGTYWIKAHYYNPYGKDIYSINAQSVVISYANIIQNVIATFDEKATLWSGAITDYAFVNSSGNLSLSGSMLMDSWADFDSVSNFDYAFGVASSGSYEIPTSHIVDLGTAQSCKCSIQYQLASIHTTNLWDDLVDFDLVVDIDGNASGSFGGLIEISLAQNDGIFGAWQQFIAGEYIARKFKARITLYSYSINITPELSAFVFSVDVPDRNDKNNGVAISAGGTTITYTTPFHAVPNNQITITNATANDDVVLTSETINGFTVQILNGGVGVARNINWLSQGY